MHAYETKTLSQKSILILVKAKFHRSYRLSKQKLYYFLDFEFSFYTIFCQILFTEIFAFYT